MRPSRSPAASRDRLALVGLELGAHAGERLDRVLLHRRVDLVRAVLRALEEPRQTAYGPPAHVQAVERALDVLERRLRFLPRDPVGRKGLLHAAVGIDNGRARVALGIEIL